MKKETDQLFEPCIFEQCKCCVEDIKKLDKKKTPICPDPQGQGETLENGTVRRSQSITDGNGFQLPKVSEDQKAHSAKVSGFNAESY